MSSSARPYSTDHQSLVPRTPRTARSTSFATKHYQLSTVEDADEIDFLQTSPLLQSARSSGFPLDSQDGLPTTAFVTEGSKARRPLPFGALEAVRRWALNAFERAPLAIGTVVALLLFGLWVLSIKQPEVLQQVIGTNSTIDGNSGSTLTSIHGIDYSNYSTFPLTSMQYEEQCWKVQEGMKGHGRFWEILPGMGLDVPHAGAKGVCSSTITYLLDGTTGLVFHLAIIAQLAAMARERDRTFIIDDRNWNRGKWTDYFQDVRKTQLGPEPGCLPPPPQELVACPRTAKHWVITPRTAKFHLGHEFDEEYQDPYKSEISRYKPIYDRAHESFSLTILLAPMVREHLDNLRATWGSKPYVGVHIRRGDRFAGNQKWKGDYVPVVEYSNAVSKAWQKLRSTEEGLDESPSVYIASDSLAAYKDYKALSTTSDGVKGLFDAESRVVQYFAQVSGYIQALWEKRSRIEERMRWTTGMILDLAMISGLWLKDGERAPLATVCTMTSNVCKIAALGLGWERALVGDWWIDVDWEGIVYPRWEAFELV